MEEKIKKENKISFVLFMIASICFYIASIICFVSDNHTGGAYVCLGSCFLCLASEHYRKYKKNKKEEK